MSVIAIIPARGNSKRIRDKNLQSLDGHSLLAWAIGSAKLSSKIDEVYVSSDSEKIKNETSRYKAKFLTRPNNLSGDFSSSLDVIKYVVKNQLKIVPKFIVLLQPTSPLREKELIDNSIRKFEASKNHNYSVEVVKFNANFAKLNNDNLEFESIRRTQDLSDRYFPSGRIFIYKTEDIFFKEKKPKIMPLFGPKHQFNINIDSEDDLILLDYLYPNLAKNFKYIKSYLDKLIKN